jgi:hypothetical protein
VEFLNGRNLMICHNFLQRRRNLSVCEAEKHHDKFCFVWFSKVLYGYFILLPEEDTFLMAIGVLSRYYSEPLLPFPVHE